VKLRNYAGYLGAELISPINYGIAAGIGAAILLLQGSGLFSTAVPYVVPVLVQSFSKSYLKFRNRHAERLLSLPGKRSDPAFIMDRKGGILLSSGETRRRFAEAGIGTLRDLLEEETAAEIVDHLPGESGTKEFQAYSPVFERWYAVKVSTEKGQDDVLVWFRDVTSYHRIDETFEQIRQYGDQIITELPRLVERDTSLDRLAPLFFSLGYQGVFIARTDDERQLSGKVYKQSAAGTVATEALSIPRDSAAPIWESRRNNRVVYAEREKGEGEEEFLRRYPVDRRVRDFLNTPVRNFVNYHEGEVSVIAFNMQREIVPRDLVAMEVLVNSARSVSSLVSYARENERRFLQSVHGLCAAAEFSDEITGQHIWRVNEYAAMLASELGFTQERQKQIGQVAAMHDIGKIAIPEIIKLDRRLTPDERERMEMHTVIGAQIIRSMITCCGKVDERLEMAGEIAFSHHQHWSGGGYPRIVDEHGSWVDPLSVSREEYRRLRPLRGEEIPVTARIVALADTYDALRSERQYKPAMDHETVTAIIRSDDRSGLSAAERFGPELAELFEEKRERMAEIYRDLAD
jgi:HD-GYP domain-containing protein (c-di-GMP phosphodiesterase class II)